jgi:hypothetical protein
MDHCDASLKVRYATESEARIALSKVQRRRSLGTTWVEQSIYHCASCSGWHITTFRSGERKPRNKVPYVRLRLRLRDLVE